MSPCSKNMSFADCELAILRMRVDEIDQKKGKKMINSPEISKIIGIVEEFLKKKKLICYGGTAINNILPLEDQFYDKDIELPDYDFYSPTPLEDAKQLAEMAKSAARVVRLFGFDPKVAFLSHSTFGQPATDRTKRLSDAVEILKKDKVDFKFDGEMQPDVALDEIYKELYPFSEIVGNSNVLVMPSQHSAAISYKMIKSMSRAKVIGPLLIGLGLPIEIAPLRSSTSEILNLASIAAYSADVIKYDK